MTRLAGMVFVGMNSVDGNDGVVGNDGNGKFFSKNQIFSDSIIIGIVQSPKKQAFLARIWPKSLKSGLNVQFLKEKLK